MRRGDLRAQDGQIMPILMVTLMALIIVGFMLFQLARSAGLRSEAQTAADAAALEATKNLREQLEAMAASGSPMSLSRVDMGAVRAAAADYAQRNGAVVTGVERAGADVRVEVRTVDRLDEAAAGLDSEEARGEARARGSFSIVASGGESAIPVGGAGGFGTQPTDGDGRISEKDWEELAEEVEDLAVPENIIALGRFLQDNGLQVGEATAFGGVLPGAHSAGGYHYKFGGNGALDINFGCGCGNLYPPEVAAIEPIIPPIRELGFNTLWNLAPGDHQDHLHIDVGPMVGGSGIGGGGTGYGDVLVELRLVPWEGAPTGIPGAFGSAPASPDAISLSQRKVAREILEVARRMNATPKQVLAAFEAAWVESQFRNLPFGDRDSLGVFQQRPSMGWGTPAQLQDVSYAAGKFFETAKEVDRGQPAGALAQDVQRSAFPEKYAQAEGTARRFLAEAEEGLTGEADEEDGDDE